MGLQLPRRRPRNVDSRKRILEEEQPMIARDFMTRDIITVSPSTKVKNLAMILIKNQISGAPVANKQG